MNVVVEESISLLRRPGIRMTQQRLAIMEYLTTSNSHPTAEEIYRELNKKLPNISNTTVYNNLNFLKEQGLIQELIFGQSCSRYEWRTRPHYHVICTECGKIDDFELPELNRLEEAAQRESNFQISGHLFELYGICTECGRDPLQS